MWEETQRRLFLVSIPPRHPFIIMILIIVHSNNDTLDNLKMLPYILELFHRFHQAPCSDYSNSASGCAPALLPATLVVATTIVINGHLLASQFPITSVGSHPLISTGPSLGCMILKVGLLILSPCISVTSSSTPAWLWV